MSWVRTPSPAPTQPAADLSGELAPAKVRRPTLRCLAVLALTYVLLGCGYESGDGEEAPAKQETPQVRAEGTEKTAAKLPEVRYYVISDA